MRTVRIGSGAGYSGDRIEPALELAEKGDIQYLVFECLGERTVALAQQARLKDPDGGFDPLLEARRIPRKLEAHYPPRARLEVQTLSGDVRGDEHRRPSTEELSQLLPPH